MDRSGRMTPLVAEPGTYANPGLSPDGTRLSVTAYRNRNWDIWVHDIERNVATRATFDEAAETEQVWSPDGRELAFMAEGGQRQPTVYRKPADGSGGGTAVATRELFMWPQGWTPDGKFLVVTSGESDIGVLSLTEKDPQPTWILNSRFAESDPAVSPDGRWIAYTSRESGTPEIYLRQFPSGTGRWQVSSGGGTYARWARSGRELFYRTATSVMAVAVDAAGDSLRTGTPRELFKGDLMGGLNGIEVGPYSFADFDVSPDGSRFVMFTKPGDSVDVSVGMVTLVSNWFQDLTRAVKEK